MAARSSLLALLLAACATTPEFQLRIEGRSLYNNCMDIYRDKRLCLNETARWCLSQGLEAECFIDFTQRQPFSSPGPRRR